MMLATTALDAILVGSTILASEARTRIVRRVAIGLNIASYIPVAWLATKYQSQADFLAFYYAAVFVTSAMRVFPKNWPLITGLSLMFVSMDIRCMFLHQNPLLTGTVMAAIFAVVQVVACKTYIELLASRIRAN